MAFGGLREFTLCISDNRHKLFILATQLWKTVQTHIIPLKRFSPTA
jgi:hypothetical protein